MAAITNAAIHPVPVIAIAALSVGRVDAVIVLNTISVLIGETRSVVPDSVGTKSLAVRVDGVLESMESVGEGSACVGDGVVLVLAFAVLRVTVLWVACVLDTAVVGAAEDADLVPEVALTELDDCCGGMFPHISSSTSREGLRSSFEQALSTQFSVSPLKVGILQRHFVSVIRQVFDELRAQPWAQSGRSKTVVPPA